MIQRPPDDFWRVSVMVGAAVCLLPTRGSKLAAHVQLTVAEVPATVIRSF